MGYAILWVGILATFLIMEALLIAVVSHSSKPSERRNLPLLFWLLYLPVLAAALFTGFSYFQDMWPPWIFWYTVSLALGILIGNRLIAHRGMKLPAGEEKPAGRLWGHRIKILLNLKEEAQVVDWPRLKLGVALIAVAAVTIATFFYMDNRALEEISRFGAEAQSQVQQMMPPRAPEAQNAWLLYEQAFKSMGAEKDLPRLVRLIPPDVSRQELVGFVEKNRSTLELLYKAAALPDWSSDADITKPLYQRPVPEFSSYRSMARLLFYSACLKADGGDAAGALGDLTVVKTMSNHIRKDPTLSAMLFSFAIDNIRVRGLEYILSYLPDHAFRQASPVKAHVTANETIHKALIWESLGMIEAWTTFATKETDNGPPRWVLRLYRVFCSANGLNALKVQNSIVAKPVRTYDEVHRNLVEANQTLINSREVLFQIYAGDPYFYVLPNIYRAMAYEARQGLADLALAMTAYKAAKGRYPDKLEELVPGYIDRIPTDPLDGKPLKIRSVKDGLELYSTADHPDIIRADATAVNFFLGREAYEELRVKPEQAKKKQ